MIKQFISFQSANTTDLIELDTSLSFEVDDFDPLNQNARQLPPVPKRSSIVLPTIPSSLPSPSINLNAESINNPIYPYHQSRPQAFSNPVYPYHQPPIAQPFRRSTDPSAIPLNHKEDDETELLRKYGLDRLNLVDAKKHEKSTINDNTGPVPFAFNSSSNNRILNPTIGPFRDNKNSNGLKTNGDIEPKTNNNWTTFD